MSSLASMPPRAVCILLLAAVPAFAAQLAGTVQDGAGHPIAGALVVGSSNTSVMDASGNRRRWIATSDAAGRFAFAGFPPGPCHVTPNGTHPALAQELAAMAAKDEAARNAWIAAGSGVSKRASAAVDHVDRANLIRLKQIIHQYGWPTGMLIGNAGMHAYWLLAQHAPPDFIAKALPHLQAAADRGEIAWSTLALMIDRDLGDRHKPQIYGSQGTFDANGHFVLSDVEDEAHLDERRAEVGLGPIADYKTLIENFYRKPSPSK